MGCSLNKGIKMVMIVLTPSMEHLCTNFGKIQDKEGRGHPRDVGGHQDFGGQWMGHGKESQSLKPAFLYLKSRMIVPASKS